MATCNPTVRRVPSPGKLKDGNWSSFTRKIKEGREEKEREREERKRGSVTHSLAERMSIQVIQNGLPPVEFPGGFGAKKL